jgi:hypothetical protein
VYEEEDAVHRTLKSSETKFQSVVWGLFGNDGYDEDSDYQA